MQSPDQLLIKARNGSYGHFISGKFTSPSNGPRIKSMDPTCDEAWYEVSDGTPAEVDDAVVAARSALVDPAWRNLTQTARGKLIHRLGELIGEHAQRFAEIETRDNGKLIREMQAQMASLPETYYFYAGMADKVNGETIPVNKRDVF